MTLKVSLFSKITVIIFLISLTLSSCVLFEGHVKKNFEQNLTPAEYGVVKHRGIRFWLYDGEKEPVDELQLVPGRYMIGFTITRNRRSGAGMCEVEAGKSYGFEVRGRQYLKTSGVYALTGLCVPLESDVDAMEPEEE